MIKFRDMSPELSQIVAGQCCVITNDKQCRRRAVDRWRVLASSPTTLGLSSYMLVPMCRKHGDRKLTVRQRRFTKDEIVALNRPLSYDYTLMTTTLKRGRRIKQKFYEVPVGKIEPFDVGVGAFMEPVKKIMRRKIKRAV